jgi:hypothetical protein
MMGRHEAPDTFPSIVSDYVTERGRALVAESDSHANMTDSLAMAAWIGSATEILRELTRDA